MTTTLPPSPAPPVAPPENLLQNLPRLRDLVPRLHLRRAGDSPGLSDDGFSDSPARIALSHELCAGLHSRPGGPGTALITLSQRALGELDLSPQRAWATAADNLLHRARETEGIRIYTRPGSHLLGRTVPALQVATVGAPPSAWLAHPRTFDVLHTHLRKLLGAEVHYLAPSRDVLLAFPAAAPELHQVLRRHPQSPPEFGPELLPGAVITYSCGFPALSAPAH